LTVSGFADLFIVMPVVCVFGSCLIRSINVLTNRFLYQYLLFFFFVGLVFELRFYSCKAESILLKPRLQSILLWLFWRWEFLKLFTKAGLKPRSSQS
jgi:hypothetical protein